jgi:hypothetical protein
MEVHAVSAALEHPVVFTCLRLLRPPYCVLFIVPHWPDTDVDTARSYSYTSMFRAMKSAILDRTNRGAAQLAHEGEYACSESSGSEAANDRVLESSSSTHSSVDQPAPDDLRSSSDHPDIMHHHADEYDSGRAWHFTQYGCRYFEQQAARDTTCKK